jgi:hypothetical protein
MPARLVAERRAACLSRTILWRSRPYDGWQPPRLRRAGPIVTASQQPLTGRPTGSPGRPASAWDHPGRRPYVTPPRRARSQAAAAARARQHVQLNHRKCEDNVLSAFRSHLSAAAVERPPSGRLGSERRIPDPVQQPPGSWLDNRSFDGPTFDNRGVPERSRGSAPNAPARSASAETGSTAPLACRPGPAGARSGRPLFHSRIPQRTNSSCVSSAGCSLFGSRYEDALR